MVTTHQIRNVLRVYGNQLKRRNTLVQENLEPSRRYADRVDISTEARHRQALNNMSQRIMSQMSPHAGAEEAGRSGGGGQASGQDTSE